MKMRKFKGGLLIADAEFGNKLCFLLNKENNLYFFENIKIENWDDT